MRKNAQLILTPLLIIVVAALLIIAFFSIGFFVLFNKYLLIGLTVIVLNFVFIGVPVFTGKYDKNKGLLFFIIMIVGVLIIFAPQIGIFQQAVLGGEEEVVLQIPHYASFKCDKIGDAFAVDTAREVPEEGLLLSANSVGFLTPGISDINVEVVSNPLYNYRLTTKVCRFGTICDTKTFTESDALSGVSVITWNVDSVNFAEDYTLFVQIESSLKLYSLGWNGEVGKISYAAEKYGLTLASTTRDPAGAIICSSSCDLDCPEQSIRDKLVSSEENRLGFDQTAPYLEFWQPVDYDVNSQAGATIYNRENNQFCFAGNIYDAGVLELENGKTYIYPETLLDEGKECCPGAVISILSGEKVCDSNYEFQEILINEDGSTNVLCPLGSDAECPGAGLQTCNLDGDNYVTSGYSCINKVCVKKDPTVVECCSPDVGCSGDMVCSEDNVCVGGAVGGGDLISDIDVNESFGITCSWYQQPYEKEVSDCGTLNWKKTFGFLPFVECETHIERGCKNADWFNVTIFILIAGLAIGAFVYVYKPKSRKKK